MKQHHLLLFAGLAALLTPLELSAGATASSVSSQNAVTSITGTAGQITASASTGDVTLSLPTALTGINSITAASATNLALSGGDLGASLTLGQGANGSITLTPTGTGGVTFSSSSAGDALSIGSAANDSTHGYFYLTRSTAYNGMYFTGNWSGQFGHAIGDETQLSITAGGGYASVDARVNIIGSAAIDHTNGFQAVSTYAGTGSITTITGYEAALYPIGSGTIGTWMGFHAYDVQASTSPLGTQIGLQIDAQTHGTINWAVYTAGTTPSFFGGKLSGTSNILQIDAAGGNQTGAKIVGTGANMGLLLTNGGSSGRDYHMYSTSSASGFGGGNLLFFDNTSSTTLAKFDSSHNFTVFGNLAVSGTGGITSTGAATFLATSNFGGAATAWVGTNGSSGLALNFPTGGRIDIDVNNTGVASCTATLFKTESGVNGQIGGNLTVNGTTGIAIGTAGATLSVKSGTNAASGTVTLAAGTATITSTAIDANTVIIFSEKTAGGTPGVYQPLAAVSAGSATVTSAATDTSTYNWIALKVAP